MRFNLPYRDYWTATPESEHFPSGPFELSRWRGGRYT